MSAIATTSSSPYDSIASLLNNAASLARANANATANKPAADDLSSSPSSGPADSVQLSDRAKAVLARAKIDQVVAEKLAAFVQSVRASDGKRNGAKPSSDETLPAPSSQRPVTFEELAGISQTSVTATASTANGNDVADNYRYAPKVTFSDTLQFNGFSIHAYANAGSWNSYVQISGPNGFLAWNTIWGGGQDAPTAGGGGGTVTAGTTFSSQMIDNKLIYTITSSSAAASAAVAQDASGSAFQSTVAAQSSVTRIVIDFETGRISALEADSSVAATVTGIRKA